MQTRRGMVEDIEEMDKIIGQFLEFGRDDREVALETRELDEIVAPLIERYRRSRQRRSHSAPENCRRFR